MQIKRRKKLKSYTLRLMSGMVAVVLLLLTAFFAISSQISQNMFRQEIEQYTLNKLEYVQQSVDIGYFSVAERAGMTIMWRSTDSAVIKLINYDASQEHYMVSEAYEALCTQRLKLLDFAQSINIYYPRSDMILSTEYGMCYLNKKGADGWVRDKEWVESILNAETHMNGWIGLRSIEDMESYGKNRNVFTYLFNPPGGSKAFLYLNIDERVIQEAMAKAMLSDEGTVFLVSADGQIYSHPDSSCLYQTVKDEPWFANFFEKESCTDFFQIDGRDMVLSSVKSDYLNMYYVYITDAEHYYQTSKMLNENLIRLFICFSMLALVISIFLAYGGSAPVRNLKKRLESAAPYQKNKHEGETEIEQLENVYDEMYSHIQYLDHVIQENQYVVKNTVLTNLLKGTVSVRQNISSQLRFADITYEKELFGVVVICLTPEIEKKWEHFSADLVFAVITDYISKNDSAKNIVILDSSTACLIVNGDEETMVEQTANKLLAVLKDLTWPIEDTIPVYIGVGGVHESLKGISCSYQEALKALEYVALFPEQTIFDYKHYKERKDTVPREWIDSMVNSLRKEADRTKELMILKEYLQREGSVQAFEIAKEEIINGISQLRVHHKTSVDTEQLTQIMEEIENADNLDEFVDCTLALLNHHNVIGSVNLQYVAKAKEYLKEHLDVPVSAEKMASILGISGTHFSRVFKNTCGESYTEYVLRIRMEEAKRLLRETSLPVRLIVEKVGYEENLSYFGKKFKAIYGMTPGEYRKRKEDRNEKEKGLPEDGRKGCL